MPFSTSQRVRALKQWGHYLYRAGVVGGSYAYANRKNSGKLLRLRPKEYAAPLFLRANTTDVTVFESVVIARMFDHISPENWEPKTILDLGANIGLFSTHCANHYPHARILALEPDFDNFRLLVRNTKPYPAVKAIQAAVWCSDCDLEVVDGHRGHCGLTVTDQMTRPEFAVTGLTMRSIMATYGLTSIDILKIDIEGSEVELFSGGPVDWLDTVTVLLIELHDRLRCGCSKAFYSAVGGRCFSQHYRSDNVVITFKNRLCL